MKNKKAKLTPTVANLAYLVYFVLMLFLRAWVIISTTIMIGIALLPNIEMETRDIRWYIIGALSLCPVNHVYNKMEKVSFFKPKIMD